jgi:hypothetical protein
MSQPRNRSGTRRMILPTVLSALLIATTGCGFFVDQGTARFPANPDVYRFSAGDGVNIEGVGPLAVRNVLVVANVSGTRGSLVAAIVNETDQDHVLHIEVGGGSDADLSISVPAETTVSFGQHAWLEDPPLIDGLDALPGAMVPIYFQAGESEGVVEEIPVLNDCLSYLRGLEPGDRDPMLECRRFPDDL